MVISDNGASAEGGPHGSVNENKFFNNVPESWRKISARSTNWAARNTSIIIRGAGHSPGTHLSGAGSAKRIAAASSDPFLVHWPKGIKAKGQIRTQFAHAIDMVPTVLECLGIDPPEQIRGVTQSPIEGVSFRHTFEDAKAAYEA